MACNGVCKINWVITSIYLKIALKVMLCNAKVDAMNMAIKMMVEKLRRKEISVDFAPPNNDKVIDTAKTRIKKRNIMPIRASAIWNRYIKLAAKLDLIDLIKP